MEGKHVAAIICPTFRLLILAMLFLSHLYLSFFFPFRRFLVIAEEVCVKDVLVTEATTDAHLEELGSSRVMNLK